MYGLSILTYDREPLIIIIAFFYVCVVIQCLYVFVLYVGLWSMAETCTGFNGHITLIYNEKK